MLIGEALRDRPREAVTISVKFGALRDPARKPAAPKGTAAGSRYPDSQMAQLDSER
jgi:hypothetical protein